MRGGGLFQRMINFKNLLCRKDGRIEPSKYSNIEISTDQIKILKLTKQDLRRATIFQDAMQESSRKLATRKLNAIGNMVGHCSILTSVKISRELQRKFKLQQLMKILQTDRKKSSP